jgi:hypothetical protein
MTVNKKQLEKLKSESTFVRFDGHKYVKGLGSLVGLWNGEEVYLK